MKLDIKTAIILLAAAALLGEDPEIWEHKVYRAQPNFCDGDGPIGKLARKYAREKNEELI